MFELALVADNIIGWSWIAQQQKGGSYYLATIPAPPRTPAAPKMKSGKTKTPQRWQRSAHLKTTTTTPITTANAPVLDSSLSATPVFTVSGESLGNVFLRGNMAHVIPVVQPPPPAASSLTPETAQMQRHCVTSGRLV